MTVKPGMENGDVIKKRGWSTAKMGSITGDINYIIRTEQHELFTRRKEHLFLNYHISLKEALLGNFNIVIPYLNGVKLVQKVPAGTVTKPDTVKVVKGKGMPIKNRNNVYGDLFIQFHVDFPTMVNLKPFSLPRYNLLLDLLHPQINKILLFDIETPIAHKDILFAASAATGSPPSVHPPR